MNMPRLNQNQRIQALTMLARGDNVSNVSRAFGCHMYLRLELHVQISLYYVLPYKAKISAQHGIGFILDR